MVDTTLLVNVAAVLVSAAVALLAVYLSYRGQLGAQHIQRIGEAFRRVMADIDSAYRTALIVGSLWDRERMTDSWSDEQIKEFTKGPIIHARIAALLTEDYITRFRLGLAMQKDLPSPIKPGHLGYKETRILIDSVSETREKAEYLFVDRMESVLRNTAGALMSGAPPGDVAAIKAFNAKLEHAVTEVRTEKAVLDLRANLTELESMLLLTAGVKSG